MTDGTLKPVRYIVIDFYAFLLHVSWYYTAKIIWLVLDCTRKELYNKFEDKNLENKNKLELAKST